MAIKTRLPGALRSQLRLFGKQNSGPVTQGGINCNTGGGERNGGRQNAKRLRNNHSLARLPHTEFCQCKYNHPHAQRRDPANTAEPSAVKQV